MNIYKKSTLNESAELLKRSHRYYYELLLLKQLDNIVRRNL